MSSFFYSPCETFYSCTCNCNHLCYLLPVLSQSYFSATKITSAGQCLYSKYLIVVYLHAITTACPPPNANTWEHFHFIFIFLLIHSDTTVSEMKTLNKNSKAYWYNDHMSRACVESDLFTLRMSWLGSVFTNRKHNTSTEVCIQQKSTYTTVLLLL
jgi:hypothetical protein